MKISSNMKLENLYHLRDRMGDEATLDDAAAMRGELLAAGWDDTADVGDDDWSKLLDRAVARTVYWTDGQDSLSLCDRLPGETDEHAIDRGLAILFDQGGPVDTGEIKIGRYR